MTDAERYLLKKYATLAGIVIVFFATFFGLSYLRKKADARYLSAAAEKLCRAFVELRHYGCFLKTDSNDVLVRENDRERQRIVAVLTAIDGHIRQDHDRVVLDIRM